MTALAPNPLSPNKPTSAYPKQAVVVIHGMGEQRPMDTLRGFVRTVWELDSRITANGLRNPAEVWSRPDMRTGSLELRRITTRQSIPTVSFPNGIRSDFYELYWADLSGGSSWGQVRDWIVGLLLRNPFTRLPRDVLLAWIILWILALAVVLFSLATVLPEKASIAGRYLWTYPPFVCLAGWEAWQLAAVAAFFAFAANWFVVPYFGRVVRYTRATPENIAARKNIRERGLALISELHKEDYCRIVVVGHSLGSILAYDIISYFWSTRYDARTVVEGTQEFNALVKLEQAAADLARPDVVPTKEARTAFLSAQRNFSRSLRLRPRPASNAPDSRWLITDLITLGSPLTHAEFLMANSADELRRHQADREFPVSPPLRELLDDPEAIRKAEDAGFNLDPTSPRLLCFPFGSADKWQLHHAAPFAAVRWTNIHDPAVLVMLGDIISGAVAPIYGPGVIDVDLRTVRGQSFRFSHTRYWSMKGNPAPPHVKALRDALDLAGQLPL